MLGAGAGDISDRSTADWRASLCGRQNRMGTRSEDLGMWCMEFLEFDFPRSSDLPLTLTGPVRFMDSDFHFSHQVNHTRN